MRGNPVRDREGDCVGSPVPCRARGGSRGASRVGRSGAGRADKAGLSTGRAGERKSGSDGGAVPNCCKE
ncbi:hypothetical protein AV530_006319 [Patagioenas fasciata monilis]|uniref:Uncharacterized protein n=1 Tax=Patagioenas fasciata monilis TaxID=372326 RepID=A0A1V4KHW6_PATFA|nr:hypothetical protein AV530_006319 [Patagioenas fasciata monilis]